MLTGDQHQRIFHGRTRGREDHEGDPMRTASLLPAALNDHQFHQSFANQTILLREIAHGRTAPYETGNDCSFRLKAK
ncbi:hypothetical protein [Bradyrhizobium genomosp. III]|uniref:hypothetical protein n=1 Tax=Bradyrhizobium genomosp. III TaxID=2683271 RepID=UPI0012F4B5EC|nr:hypothetical protein [Bradyrhizobium sp. CCBAU 15635]